MSVGIRIVNSKNCYFGDIRGKGLDTLIKFENSTEITVGKLKHISDLRYSILYMSVINAIYDKKYYLGKNYMSNNDKSCTISAVNSKNIKTGNIHSDAHQVVLLENVENFTTGDIYHFQKDREKVDETFDTIKKSISMHELPEGIQAQALALSGELKEKYLSKDIQGFKNHYQELTNFLSSHVTLYTFVLPVFQNLMSSLLN